MKRNAAFLMLSLALGVPVARAGDLTIEGNLTVQSNLTAASISLGGETRTNWPSDSVALTNNSVHTSAIQEDAVTGAKILDRTVGGIDITNALVLTGVGADVGFTNGFSSNPTLQGWSFQSTNAYWESGSNSVAFKFVGFDAPIFSYVASQIRPVGVYTVHYEVVSSLDSGGYGVRISLMTGTTTNTFRSYPNDNPDFNVGRHDVVLTGEWDTIQFRCVGGGGGPVYTWFDNIYLDAATYSPPSLEVGNTILTPTNITADSITLGGVARTNWPSGLISSNAIDWSTMPAGIQDGDDITTDASLLTTGTIPNDRLSSNVSLLGQSIASSEVEDGTLSGVDLATSITLTSPLVTNGEVIYSNDFSSDPFAEKWAVQNNQGNTHWVSGDGVIACDFFDNAFNPKLIYSNNVAYPADQYRFTFAFTDIVMYAGQSSGGLDFQVFENGVQIYSIRLIGSGSSWGITNSSGPLDLIVGYTGSWNEVRLRASASQIITGYLDSALFEVPSTLSTGLSSFSAGEIQSTGVGFVFPDGTTQTTASALGSSVASNEIDWASMPAGLQDGDQVGAGVTNNSVFTDAIQNDAVTLDKVAGTIRYLTNRVWAVSPDIPPGTNIWYKIGSANGSVVAEHDFFVAYTVGSGNWPASVHIRTGPKYGATNPARSLGVLYHSALPIGSNGFGAVGIDSGGNIFVSITNSSASTLSSVYMFIDATALDTSGVYPVLSPAVSSIPGTVVYLAPGTPGIAYPRGAFDSLTLGGSNVMTVGAGGGGDVYLASNQTFTGLNSFIGVTNAFTNGTLLVNTIKSDSSHALVIAPWTGPNPGFTRAVQGNVSIQAANNDTALAAGHVFINAGHSGVGSSSDQRGGNIYLTAGNKGSAGPLQTQGVVEVKNGNVFVNSNLLVGFAAGGPQTNRLDVNGNINATGRVTATAGAFASTLTVGGSNVMTVGGSGGGDSGYISTRTDAIDLTNQVRTWFKFAELTRPEALYDFVIAISGASQRTVFQIEASRNSGPGGSQGTFLSVPYAQTHGNFRLTGYGSSGNTNLYFQVLPNAGGPGSYAGQVSIEVSGRCLGTGVQPVVAAAYSPNPPNSVTTNEFGLVSAAPPGGRSLFDGIEVTSLAFADGTYMSTAPSSGSGGGGDVYAASNNVFTGSNSFIEASFSGSVQAEGGAAVGVAGPRNTTLMLRSGGDQLGIDDSDGPADARQWVLKSDNGQLELITANDSWSSWDGAVSFYRTGVDFTSMQVKGDMQVDGAIHGTGEARIEGGALVGADGPRHTTFLVRSGGDQLGIEDVDSPADEKLWVWKSDNSELELITANDNWDSWDGVLRFRRTGSDFTQLVIRADTETEGHILPSQGSSYDLGSAAQPWRDLYLGTNSLYMGTNKLSVSATGQPIWNGEPVSAGGGGGGLTTNSADTLYVSKVSTNDQMVQGTLLIGGGAGHLGVSNSRGYLQLKGVGGEVAGATLWATDAGGFYRGTTTTHFAGTRFQMWDEGNDGAGSGLDADTIDGLDSTDFVAKGGGAITGAVTVAGGMTVSGPSVLSYVPPQGDLSMGTFTNGAAQ